MTMKNIAAGMAVALALATSALWAAGPGSKCDASISKAAGKLVACRCGVYAKAQLKATSPDTAKLAKCDSKFATSCAKAQSKGGCLVQGGSCDAKASSADSGSLSLCGSSAEPAFTD